MGFWIITYQHQRCERYKDKIGFIEPAKKREFLLIDAYGVWRKIVQSRMNMLQQDQDGWSGEKGMMEAWGWRKKHNLTECATG